MDEFIEHPVLRHDISHLILPSKNKYKYGWWNKTKHPYVSICHRPYCCRLRSDQYCNDVILRGYCMNQVRDKYFRLQYLQKYPTRHN